MKFYIGLLVALCMGAFFVSADTSMQNILSNQDVQNYIVQKLRENSQVLQIIVKFLQDNGVNMTSLLSGNHSALQNPQLLESLKVLIQQNDVLKAFVFDILTHFNIPLGRIDWGSIGSAILDAVPTVIQYLPTIISIAGLFGKRDLTNEQIEMLLTRIDWGAIGSALLGAVNVAVDNLPTIISIVNLFGKRDIAQEQIQIILTRIDWGAIGSALLGAVNVAVDNLPTIISIVNLLGK